MSNVVILSSVALSNNPQAKVVDHVDGINGKLNQTSDGRLYCVMTFEDNDPFQKSRTVRTYSSNENGKFRGATPNQLLKIVGKTIEGARFVTKQVEPYMIGEGENARQVSSYTSVVLAKETIETVFKNAGHVIVSGVKVAENSNIEASVASMIEA